MNQPQVSLADRIARVATHVLPGHREIHARWRVAATSGATPCPRGCAEGSPCVTICEAIGVAREFVTVWDTAEDDWSRLQEELAHLARDGIWMGSAPSPLPGGLRARCDGLVCGVEVRPVRVPSLPSGIGEADSLRLRLIVDQRVRIASIVNLTHRAFPVERLSVDGAARQLLVSQLARHGIKGRDAAVVMRWSGLKAIRVSEYMIMDGPNWREIENDLRATRNAMRRVDLARQTDPFPCTLEQLADGIRLVSDGQSFGPELHPKGTPRDGPQALTPDA